MDRTLELLKSIKHIDYQYKFGIPDVLNFDDSDEICEG